MIILSQQYKNTGCSYAKIPNTIGTDNYSDIDEYSPGLRHPSDNIFMIQTQRKQSKLER